MNTIWTMPTGMPKTVAIFNGESRASVMILVLHPESGEGQGRNPAGEKEDLEVMFDLFYPEREDQHQKEDGHKAEVDPEIH
jgi:hypothetical protein